MENTINHLTFSASVLRGTPVRNAADEKLGEIKDVMLDIESGRVAYAVLSLDTGVLKLDSKYFAIPWEAFHFDATQDEIIILNIDKEKLKNAPGFDKNRWPTSPQYNFINEVHTYYGLEPYYLLL